MIENKVFVSKIISRQHGYCIVEVFSNEEKARNYQEAFCSEIENWMEKYSISITEKVIY